MNKPQITITIGGPSGSGKSLLAEHFATYLHVVLGLNVELRDDGDIQQVPAVHNPLRRINADIAIHVEQK